MQKFERGEEYEMSRRRRSGAVTRLLTIIVILLALIVILIALGFVGNMTNQTVIR